MVLTEFLEEWNNDSPQLLVHTSGSTGTPKPMWVDKAKMRAGAALTCHFLGLKSGDTALLCMPLDYIAGKMMVVRALEGNLRLISVDPTGHPLKNVNDPIRFAAMVPMQVYNSLQVEEEAAKLRTIDHLLIGGGAISEELEEALRDFPNCVWSSYGMTETLSHIALRRINGVEASDWYTPLPGVSLSVNAEGCLVIDAPRVCDGQLTTNDRVELKTFPVVDKTEDMHMSVTRFRVLGRKDNVITCGGVKIQMEEVEQLLRRHIRMPFLITKAKDEKFGEKVVLLFESGTENADSTLPYNKEDTAAYLQKICKEVLPKYWQPRGFVAVGQLPMTETGKPRRSEAERMAEQWRNGEPY